jgi:hypothetical protein
MIDPPPWGECLPRTTDHGYPNTATVPQRMSAIAKTVMKNRDRDDRHSRRRDAGGDDGSPDGRAVADALYGGLTSNESTDEDDGES